MARTTIAHATKHIDIETDGCTFELIDSITGIAWKGTYADIASAVAAAKEIEANDNLYSMCKSRPCDCEASGRLTSSWNNDSVLQIMSGIGFGY